MPWNCFSILKNPSSPSPLYNQFLDGDYVTIREPLTRSETSTAHQSMNPHSVLGSRQLSQRVGSDEMSSQIVWAQQRQERFRLWNCNVIYANMFWTSLQYSRWLNYGHEDDHKSISHFLKYMIEHFDTFVCHRFYKTHKASRLCTLPQFSVCRLSHREPPASSSKNFKNKLLEKMYSYLLWFIQTTCLMFRTSLSGIAVKKKFPWGFLRISTVPHYRRLENLFTVANSGFWGRVFVLKS